jgi:FixJ family two-component response regulator
MDAKIESRKAVLISIVDDDDLMRRSTRRLLRSTGFRAEAFASAEEFLTSGEPEETACLILDLRMPGMNGLQLQRHLVEQGSRIPIIFITAQENQEFRREAMQAGAVHFLQKPVREAVLLQVIRSALKTPPEDERIRS